MRRYGAGAVFFLLLSVGMSRAAGQESSPMSIPASKDALQEFLKPYAGRDFLTFPETRERPIRLFDGIPQSWATRAPQDLMQLEVSAQPGEYFVFQIGVFAHRTALRDLRARWTALSGPSTVAEANITCFNLGGIDYLGRPFRKRVDVVRGRVQPLWFGVAIPIDAQGSYRTRITIEAEAVEATTVEVLLNVTGETITNSGFDRGKSLSRLAWLNSSLGVDAGPTKGYPAPRRSGRRFEILGRTIEIGDDGLPSSISTSFEPSNQFLLDTARALLSGPFRFVIEKEDGSRLILHPGALEFTSESSIGTEWTVRGGSPEVSVSCSARLEFDGFMDYCLGVSAGAALSIKDIRLEVPLRREMAEYMMGLNYEGGLRPRQWNWHWDTTRNQDMLWIGAVHGGLRFKWKAENYVRPLINIYYAYGPLHLPPSWGNGGRGGVSVTESGDTVLVSAFSGPRELKRGDTLHYDLELLVTPLKVIDTGVRWEDRYFHGGGTSARQKIAMADSVGSNIINIHHAEDIYPFINYPYLDENVSALRDLVEDAHAHDKRLKLYYTTRELTKNLPEFWALFSLDGEAIYPGPGETCTTIINPRGPDPWLKMNLKERYIPAWLNRIVGGPFSGELDLAVLTTPDSRLNNFYIGGLDWMLGHLGIDGVYVDDSALDRVTMRRARTLIDSYRARGRIDFHSWNHFNNLAGYANCLNLYMDLLPYIDLVWIGEQRDYDRMPDHWLIEISGIPYGASGQMLHGGGNPWRGMVYGITNRPGWAGNPAEIWRVWDSVDISSTRMIGYWDAQSPVRSDNELVKATLYAGAERSILAVAGWGETDQTCTLSVDWRGLGYDVSTCSLSIPPIRDYQEAASLASLDRLTVPAGKGYLIVIERTR